MSLGNIGCDDNIGGDGNIAGDGNIRTEELLLLLSKLFPIEWLHIVRAPLSQVYI
jgi:hypothetical protein